MRTTIEFRAVTVCPFDGETVSIKTVVTVNEGFLPVENLIAAIREATAEPVTQEDFTLKVFAAVKRPIKTTGTHSGVTIKCSCS